MYFLNHHTLRNYAFGWKSKTYPIIAAILLLLFTPLSVEGAGNEDNIALADSLFREGQFTEAEAVYAECVRKEPDAIHRSRSCLCGVCKERAGQLPGSALTGQNKLIQEFFRGVGKMA